MKKLLFILFIGLAMAGVSCSSHNENNGEKPDNGLHQNAIGSEDGQKDSTERDHTQSTTNDTVKDAGRVNGL